MIKLLRPHAAAAAASLLSLGLPQFAQAQEGGSSDSITAAQLSRQLQSDPNGYVLSLQVLLSAQGLYDGDRSGQLTRETISAINRFCAQAEIVEACRWGPLSRVGSAALVAELTAEARPEEPVTERAAPPIPATDNRDGAMPAEPVSAEGGDDQPDAEIVAASGLPLQDGSSLDGWSANFGTGSIENGRYRVSNTDTEFSARLFKEFPTIEGDSYTLRADGYPGSVPTQIAISNTSNITGALLTAHAIGEGFEQSFVATADTTYVLLVAPASSADAYAEFDNVEVVADLAAD